MFATDTFIRLGLVDAIDEPISFFTSNEWWQAAYVRAGCESPPVANLVDRTTG